MKMLWRSAMPLRVLILFLAVLIASTEASAATGLQVTYGGSGLQRLSYNGVVLEDVSQNSSDAFHIWHMKLTDLSGNVLNGGQYNWGEANNGRSWDAATTSWTYQFTWGSLRVQYAQSGDTLNMIVTA
jgi:hypothetical protein